MSVLIILICLLQLTPDTATTNHVFIEASACMYQDD
jgi:hypothetical protein